MFSADEREQLVSTSDVSATDSGDTMDTAEDESLDMGDEALDMGDVNGNSTKGRPILSVCFGLGEVACLCTFFCFAWVKLLVFFVRFFLRLVLLIFGLYFSHCVLFG